MEGTQPCYNCKLYFCFCKNSIKIHKLLDKLTLDEKSLYCDEKLEDSPPTKKIKIENCNEHRGKKRKHSE